MIVNSLPVNDKASRPMSPKLVSAELWVLEPGLAD
jgi:hypothetical protein